jgi:FkbM family methyltransferase
MRIATCTPLGVIVMLTTIKNIIKRNSLLFGLLSPIIYLRRMITRYRNSIPTEDCFAILFEPVIAGTLVVRLPKYGGDFEIDARSHILSRILTTKEYEPRKKDIINRYFGEQKMDAIDVGANIGLFTVLFSKLLCSYNRVLSIEPNPYAVSLLHKNIAMNGYTDRVIVFEGVVAERSGNVRLHMIPGMPEYSCIESITHPAMKEKSTQAHAVDATSLDALVNRFNLRPGFIKIDTEGSEYHVLRGAEDTLKKYRPVVLCEIRDDLLSCIGHNSEEIILLMEDFGYRVLNIDAPEVPVRAPFIGEILALPKVERDSCQRLPSE